MANIIKPWAIILCKYNDKPNEIRPRTFYEDFFINNGMGGVCDYWREVTLNALDLTTSEVFGWFTMNHPSADSDHLTYPGERYKLVQWGKDAAIANGINLASFGNRILVIQNYGNDHGAAGIGVVIVHKDPNLIEVGFICHEMGHGFGLPHSFSSNPDFEYGDGWDIMSFATTTPLFDIKFRGAEGKASIGLNARNLEALGALPSRRVFSIQLPNFSESINLDPLNQIPMGNHGFLVVKILPSATQPNRNNDSIYTIEFRIKAGWDKAIPQNAIIIHEVRSNGLSYLQPGMWGQFLPNQQFVTPDPKVFIKIVSFDNIHGFASVRLWDIPNGSFRKEDTRPEVYLIQGGQKQHITSPQVLFALGRTWADIKSVPDGGLSTVSIGLPITMVNRNGIGNYDLLNPSDQVFAFDYTSSGKLDHLVLYRPGDQVIYILVNNAGNFTPVFA